MAFNEGQGDIWGLQACTGTESSKMGSSQDYTTGKAWM